MKLSRKILAITGTRSDYGLMSPVYQQIQTDDGLELELIVTGMHLLPEFESGLVKIRKDGFGKLHYVSMTLGEDNSKAMAQSFGLAAFGIPAVLDSVRPEIILLQGDRGEMLAGAIAAAHLNIPIVHLSGGDYSGSIDDAIRNALSKFAHIHLTTCELSSKRLLMMGEESNRIFQVGEPGVDLIQQMQYIPGPDLATELNLDLSQPVIIAAQHPVTTETDQAAWQIEQTLQALVELKLQTVFTYPNSDAGGREMVRVLEGYRQYPFIRIVANLGSLRFLSLLKVASVMVGNSSSGIFEAPSFKIPVVNIGTRQYGRQRASNVIEVDYDSAAIKDAIRYALTDQSFREQLRDCINPYGDGTAAIQTISILKRLKLSANLLTKWLHYSESFLGE